EQRAAAIREIFEDSRTNLKSGLDHFEKETSIAQILIDDSLCLSSSNGGFRPNFRFTGRTGGLRNLRLNTGSRYNTGRCSGRSHDHQDGALRHFECPALT